MGIPCLCAGGASLCCPHRCASPSAGCTVARRPQPEGPQCILHIHLYLTIWTQRSRKPSPPEGWVSQAMFLLGSQTAGMTQVDLYVSEHIQKAPMLGRTLIVTKARIWPFKQSSTEMYFQISSTGQGKESSSAWVFETRFHYAPEAELNLVAILLQPPKCLLQAQCPASRCLEGATDR